MSQINEVTLRAMGDELSALHKEAGVANMFGRLGAKVIKGGASAAQSLGKGTGTVGSLARRAGTAVGTATKGAIKTHGAKNVTRAVGAATVGAGAVGLGAGAVGVNKLMRRRQNNAQGAG